MKTLPTLYELQFIDAAFFPCPEQKIARFTTKLIEAYQSSATLLEEIKTAAGPNKEALYKAARILDQDFSKYVKEKARKLILRANGWNVDVPLTSHYRQGRGKKRGRKPGRPKKLTGNSYYAAMGKKGGRPKLYG